MLTGSGKMSFTWAMVLSPLLRLRCHTFAAPCQTHAGVSFVAALTAGQTCRHRGNEIVYEKILTTPGRNCTFVSLIGRAHAENV
ncbi:hypothetical protein GGR55DRAFT_642110 [Xylaria sp. FL0064]|nr:hypothetical protein GGR55DRAFT_642110 [Xylaria sp. FL0064]